MAMDLDTIPILCGVQTPSYDFMVRRHCPHTGDQIR